MTAKDKKSKMLFKVLKRLLKWSESTNIPLESFQNALKAFKVVWKL